MNRDGEHKGRSREKTRILVPLGFVVVLLLLVAGLSLMAEMRWSGSFRQREYQITFQDANGNPIPGVEVRVEDEAGNPVYGYPVTDYFPPNVPTSDARGVLTFHHVYSGVEFSGRLLHLYWLYPIGESEAPRYVCRFFYKGREILEIPFSEMNRADGGPNGEVV